MTLLLAIPLIALGMLIAYGLFPFKRFQFRHIPGPKPLWLIGNLPGMVEVGQHEAYSQWAKQHGPTFKIWMGAFPVIITEDPDAAHSVCKKCVSRHPVPLADVGEDAKLNDLSIVFARGALWKSFRFAWQPMFNSGSLQAFAALMRGKAEKLVIVMQAASESQQPVDIVTTFNEMTMEVVGETAYGVDFDILPTITTTDVLGIKSIKTNDNKKEMVDSTTTAATTEKEVELETETRQLVRAMKAFFIGTAQMGAGAVACLLMFPSLAPCIKWLVNKWPSKDYSELLKSRSLIRSVSAKLLRQAQSLDTPTDNTGKDILVKKADNSKGVKPGSFIDLLTKSMNKETGRPFTDLDIISNSFFFLVSGNETTSTALTFAVYLLSSHPDKEAQVLAEVDKFDFKGIKKPSYDDINTKFPYIDAVIKEALRLYPPVHIATREAEKEMQVGPYTVPAGTALQVSTYGMHRSPRYWKDPLAFIPERFIAGSEEAKGNNFDAYMPFGDGPRGCIGNAYAVQEVKMTLITLYQRFQMRVVENKGAPIRLRTTITLGPADPILIKVQPRTTPHK